MNFRRIGVVSIGPIAAAIVSAVTVPVLAWGFTVEDIGRYQILVSTISVCVIVLYLGLDQSYVREFHETPNKPGLLKSTLSTGMALSVVLVAIALAFAEPLSAALFGRASVGITAAASGCLLIAVLARQQALVLRMTERLRIFSFAIALPKILFVVIVVIVIVGQVRPDFFALVMALLISSGIVVLVLIIPNWRDWTSALVSTSVPRWPLLQFGVPLMLGALAYTGVTAGTVAVLRVTSDLSDIGIYSAALSVAGVMGVMQSIFSLIWAPMVYKWVALGEERGRVGEVARQVLVVAILGCGVVALVFWGLDYVLPPQFSSVKFLLFGAVLQPVLYTLGEVTAVGVNIARRTRLATWAAAVALTFGVGTAVCLTPALGAQGAIIANMIAFALYFALRTEFSARVWESIPRVTIYVVLATLFVMSVLTVTLGAFVVSFAITLVWVAFVVTVLVVLRRDVRALAAVIRGRRTS